MEQRPLPNLPDETAAEPHLELVTPVVEDVEPEEREEASEPQTQDPLKLYVRQIGDGRLLTAAEERELARRKDEGDEAAKRRLIECNLRLVMSITRNYTKSGFPERRVEELLDLVEDPVSLETPVGDGESLYADLIEDVHSDQPDESTAKRLRSAELAEALMHLNPRMQRVLSLRFGLEDGKPQTLEEVGAGLGITRERVRQLEARALRELRTVAPDLELYLRA